MLLAPGGTVTSLVDSSLVSSSSCGLGLALPFMTESSPASLGYIGQWVDERTVRLVATALLIVAVLLPKLSSRLKRGRERKEHIDVQQESVALDRENAEICWERGVGRLKHCGLRPEPRNLSAGLPKYSLEPLELPLPDLSASEQESLTELTRRVAKFSDRHRIDPGTLVRFLRARKFRVDAAESLFCKAVDYWEQHDVRNALTSWNLEAYERCLSPWWLAGGFFGHGLRGEMIAYERLSKCNWPKLKETLPWEEIEKLDIVHCIRALAACEEDSMRSGIPLGNGILVQDCDGFTWEQTSFSSAVALNRLVQNRNLLMPECLSLILVIRAPPSWLYSWQMFKHILEPGIREKVRVALPGADSLELLRRYIGDEDIPAYLGGKRTFDGDPECRQVLSPGGFPPRAAIDRFFELVRSNGSSGSFGEHPYVPNKQNTKADNAELDKRSESSCGCCLWR